MKGSHNVLVAVVGILLSVSLLLGGLLACAGPETTPTPATPAPTTPAPTTPAPTAMPTIEWDMPTNCAPGDEYFLPIRQWMVNEIASKTDGHLKVNLRYLGELGVPDIELPRMVAQGTLETSYIPVPMFLDIPWASVDILPFLVNGADEGKAVAEALRPLFIKGFREYGYEFLPMNALENSGTLWANQAIPTIESMKGLKVRTTGPHIPKLAAEWGMEPATVDPTELYLAMQRGVVDAAFAGHYWGLTVKMNEVAKYSNVWNYCYWHDTWVISSAEWNKLPGEWQKMIVEDISPKVAQMEYEAQLRQDAETLDKDRALGLTVIEPSDEELAKAADAGLKLAHEWADKVGPQGQEVLNAMLKALGK